MYHTNCKVTLGLYDDGAKAVMTPSVTGPIQPWSNINCLKEDSIEWERWGTLEKNRFKNDGSWEWMPDLPATDYCWSIWGSELSNDLGALSTPIVITLNFENPRTTVGFDIHFDVPGEEWASEMQIEWFDQTGFRLSSRTYTPDRAYYFASNFVTGFTRVVFTFTATSKPGRYFKLMNIDMGHLHTFSSETATIFECSINEDYDPTSQELTVNTFSLKAWDPDSDFSFLNRDSFAAGITDYQSINVWEYVEGEEVFMGKFYLNTWKCPSQNVAEFTGKDIVGTMDGDYHQGGIYANKLASELVAEIFSGGYEYNLDSTLASVRLNGWLPSDTVRHNLKQVAFALGANIITARDNKVNIVPDQFRSHTFYSFSRQFLSGTSFELLPLVTNIILYTHNYSTGTLLEELHKETFSSTGDYIINFNAPVHNYSVTSGNATILYSHPNWCTIRVNNSSSEVVIEGYYYVDSVGQLERTPSTLPPIYTTNIKRFENGTLVGRYNGTQILDRLAAYYNQRIIGTCLVRLEPDELIGDQVTMTSWHDNRLRGNVEEYQIDLAQGFRAGCKLVGDLAPADWEYFMTEIIMDSDVVI